jgi:hypothetical protein
VHHVLTEWFDPVSGQRRLRDELGGVVVSDVLLRRTDRGTGFSEATLARFPALYRSALLIPEQIKVTSGRLDGKPVYWLGFAPATGALRAVAINKETYTPVRAVFADGTTGRSFQVTSLSAFPKGSSIAPPPIARPRHLARVTLRSVSPDQAPTRGVRSYDIVYPRLGRATHLYVGTRNGSFAIADAQFATRAVGRLTRIQESRQPEPQLGWTATFTAVAKRPNVAFVGRDGGRWSAFLRAGGRYFRVTSTLGRAQVVRVAEILAKRL